MNFSVTTVYIIVLTPQVLFSPEYEVVYAFHQGVELELPIANAELEAIKLAHQVCPREIFFSTS